nr:hypothetical protein [Elizabethkingia sp. ASV34]
MGHGAYAGVRYPRRTNLQYASIDDPTLRVHFYTPHGRSLRLISDHWTYFDGPSIRMNHQDTHPDLSISNDYSYITEQVYNYILSPNTLLEFGDVLSGREYLNSHSTIDASLFDNAFNINNFIINNTIGRNLMIHNYSELQTPALIRRRYVPIMRNSIIYHDVVSLLPSPDGSRTRSTVRTLLNTVLPQIASRHNRHYKDVHLLICRDIW